MKTVLACPQQVCVSNQLCWWCWVALHWVVCCQLMSWMGMSSELVLNLGNRCVCVCRVWIYRSIRTSSLKWDIVMWRWRCLHNLPQKRKPICNWWCLPIQGICYFREILRCFIFWGLNNFHKFLFCHPQLHSATGPLRAASSLTVHAGVPSV